MVATIIPIISTIYAEMPTETKPSVMPEEPVNTEITKHKLTFVNYKSWAILNLILCLAGARSAAMIIVRVLFDKSNPPYNNNEKRYRLISHTIVFTVCIVGVLLFIRTQNLHGRMILADIWTPAHIVILITEIAFFNLAGKHLRRG